jgi:hypothetical protein
MALTLCLDSLRQLEEQPFVSSRTINFELLRGAVYSPEWMGVQISIKNPLLSLT